MKYFYSLLCLLFVSQVAFGQADGDYRSRQTGNWSNPTTWQVYNSGFVNLEDPAAGPYQNITPTDASGIITIQSGNVVTITADISIDDATVNSGGTVILNSGINLDFPSFQFADVFTINGTFNNSGSFNAGILSNIQIGGTFINNQGATFNNSDPSWIFFNANSTYDHRYTTTNGAIPSAAWDVASTCLISGFTTNAVAPSNLSQEFGNFTWNTPLFSSTSPSFVNLAGALTAVDGDLRIVATGTTGAKTLQFAGTGNSGFTLDIGGDLKFDGGTISIVVNTSSPTTINVGGNYSQTLANVVITQTAGDVTLNIAKNFTKTGGTLTRVASGVATLSFNGGGPTQFYSYGGSAIASAINFSISNSSVLDLGTSALTGTGTFTLGPSATLKVGSVASVDINGAIQTGTTAGNIRVPTVNRTYNSSGTIVYNGAAAQKIGNGFPSNVNLQISNASGVTNNNIGVTNVVGNLTLTNGALFIGSSNTLNIQSNFITTGGTIGGDITSNLTFSGSATTTNTLSFASGTEFLNNLTVGRTGDLVLGSSLTVGNTIALSFGNLDFSGQTLTMNGGSITASSTGLKSSSTSNLVFGGSTFSGPVPFLGTNQLNNLTFSTPGGTFTWNSNVTVNNTLLLTAGALTNSSGLTMATNSTISVGGGSLTGTSPLAVTSYNVIYTGAVTTGLELPSSSTALKNLTISSSGTVVLGGSTTINGNFLASSGTLSAGANNLTMKGATWTVNGGVFSGGTGTVTFSATTVIGGSGTINFNNINASSGSNLTFPSGTINISGDLNLNSGATFTNGGGTVLLNGTGVQTITASGKNLNNITVNKSSGSVDILPTLNLVGELDILTATTVAAHSGNLVLLSTSDAASGNASIAKIPVGAGVSGTVVTQRYMSAEGRIYRDFSSPVTAATVQDLMNSGITVTGFAGSSFPCAGCATNGPSMYYYDETVAGAIANGYTPITSAAQVLTPGHGFNVLIRNELGQKTISLTGPINSGTIPFAVSYTSSGSPANDGWNFVGNPYPSTIDWDASTGWTKSGIVGNMISVWDAGVGAYKTWNSSTGSLGNGRIAQGQGFWIQANATPTLTVTEDAKTGTTGAFYRKKAKPVHTVEVVLTGTKVEDRTYIQQAEGATLAFDAFDGSKLTFDNFSMSTLTADNRNVAINAVGDIIQSGKIPILIANIEKGDYTFTANSVGDFVGIKVSIFDKNTNALQDLSDPKGYTFSVTENENSRRGDRFVLVFGNETVGNSILDGITLYPNPVSNSVKVQVNTDNAPLGEVVDIMGKSVGTLGWEKEPNSITWNGAMDMQSQATGIYFVRVKISEGVRVIKFIKN